MGNGDHDKPRTLRLERETLRDLAPSASDAAAVRGGQSSICGGKERCQPPAAEAVMSLLPPQTMISWGCQGSIRINPTDVGGYEIIYDLRANQDLIDHTKSMMDRLG